LQLLKIAVAGILLLATVVAVALAVSGVVPRALELVGVCWAIYGLVVGVVDGFLEPVINGMGRVMMDIGLRRAGAGFSGIEALAARGHYEAAAEAYRERAREPRVRAAATVRRAGLLAGPLEQPETAAAELDALRADGRTLPPADDIHVGLALADLYEHALGDPGRAMAELRRLLDLYPEGTHLRRIRRELAELKRARFPQD
jgi:tetratricopeptide (TPR) repeat protein